MIRFAREHDLPLAIHGGGHNGGGLGSVDDGVVIDLSLLKAITVDPAHADRPRRRRGLWGEVDAATQPHGLAVPTGIISTTGVAGLTLGGGHGYLTRRHGLTIDNLLSAELVLADGYAGHRERGREPRSLLGDPRRRRQLRRRDRVHVPGASGRDDRRRPDVLGARGHGRAPRRLPRVAAVRAAQRDGLLQLPHHPAGARRSRRRSTCARCAGSSGASTPRTRRRSKAMAPMLDVAEPLMHGVGRMPITDLNSAFDGLYGPGDQWYWRGDFVQRDPRRGDRAEPRVERRMPTCKSRLAHLPDRRRRARRRGRGHRVRLPGRDLVAGVRRRRRRPGLGAGAARLDDRLLGGAAPLRGRRRLRQLHDGRGPGSGCRRRTGRTTTGSPRVKATYDPDNVFRVNQNILPAAG